MEVPLEERREGALDTFLSFSLDDHKAVWNHERLDSFADILAYFGDSAPNIFYVVDYETGVIRYASPAFREWYGEPGGQLCSALLEEEHKALCRICLTRPSSSAWIHPERSRKASYRNDQGSCRALFHNIRWEDGDNKRLVLLRWSLTSGQTGHQQKDFKADGVSVIESPTPDGAAPSRLMTTATRTLRSA